MNPISGCPVADLPHSQAVDAYVRQLSAQQVRRLRKDALMRLYKRDMWTLRSSHGVRSPSYSAINREPLADLLANDEERLPSRDIPEWEAAVRAASYPIIPHNMFDQMSMLHIGAGPAASVGGAGARPEDAASSSTSAPTNAPVGVGAPGGAEWMEAPRVAQSPVCATAPALAAPEQHTVVMLDVDETLVTSISFEGTGEEAHHFEHTRVSITQHAVNNDLVLTVVEAVNALSERGPNGVLRTVRRYVLELASQQLAEKRVIRTRSPEGGECVMVVMVRPGARQFLRRLHEVPHQQLAVWTAGTREYARACTELLFAHDQQLLNTVVWDRRTCHRLTDPLPQQAVDAGLQVGDFIKPLSILFQLRPEFHAGNTVLIDNQTFVAIQYPNNLVHVPHFELLPQVDLDEADHQAYITACAPGWTPELRASAAQVRQQYVSAGDNNLSLLPYNNFMDGENAFQGILNSIRRRMVAAANEQARFPVPIPACFAGAQQQVPPQQ